MALFCYFMMAIGYINLEIESTEKAIYQKFENMNEKRQNLKNKLMDKAELIRCNWCISDPIYMEYHDKEWGVPVYDDQKLFEFLILEGAQAGLSWITILKRREGYRKAFAHFDVEKVAAFDEAKIAHLLLDPGIIRNNLKVRAAVTNAQQFIKISQEFGSFSEYIWRFTNGEIIMNHPKTLKDVPATSQESDAMSKDLKKRGFKFVGSTIMYAHMQATGMINDHIENCWCKNKSC